MADNDHTNGETGAPEPDEVTEVTQASAPAEGEPAAVEAAEAASAAADEESTAVMATADDEATQVAAGAGGDGTRSTAVADAGPAPQPSAPPPHRPSDRPFPPGCGGQRPDDVDALHGHEHRRLHAAGRTDRQGPAGHPEPEHVHRRPGGGRHRPAAARERRPAGQGEALRRPHHRRRRGLHHQGHQEGAQLAQGLRAVAQDQRGRPREDRRAAARRIDDRVHLRQRREAQPAAARQPGARVGGREAAGRALEPLLPARHRARRRPRGLHPGGGELVGQAAVVRLRADHPASSPTLSGRRRRPSSGSTGSCGSSRSSPRR